LQLKNQLKNQLKSQLKRMELNERRAMQWEKLIDSFLSNPTPPLAIVAICISVVLVIKFTSVKEQREALAGIVVLGLGLVALVILTLYG